MTMLTLITALLAIIAICGVIYTTIQWDELEERKEELDKYSVHLDERDNRISADEATIRELYKELNEELKRQRK